MSLLFDGFTVAIAIAVGFATVLVGMNASPDRARRLLGDRIRRFEGVDRDSLDLELSRAMRAASWGLPGISMMMIVAVFFRALTYFAPRFQDRFWLALIVAAGVGGTISYLQGVVFRKGVLRHLERRLPSTP